MAPIADVAVVWAYAKNTIRGFVVPTDIPGFSAPENKRKLSLRTSVTSELVPEEVRLPECALFPEASGLSRPLSCRNGARYGIVFDTLGAAGDCLGTAIAIAQECRTIMGAAGITLEYPVMRHANNLESVLTSTAHQLVIGQELTDRLRSADR